MKEGVFKVTGSHKCINDIIQPKKKTPFLKARRHHSSSNCCLLSWLQSRFLSEHSGMNSLTVRRREEVQFTITIPVFSDYDIRYVQRNKKCKKSTRFQLYQTAFYHNGARYNILQFVNQAVFFNSKSETILVVNCFTLFFLVSQVSPKTKQQETVWSCRISIV